MNNASPSTMDNTVRELPFSRNWLSVLRQYLMATAVLQLIWEFAHMPLYTLWETGSATEIIFAAIHCAGGDVLIALAALMAALLLVGHRLWPDHRSGGVFVVTLIFGVTYTVFSEWLNIVVRASWAYSDAMPVVPLINMGLSPLLQWIVVPSLAFRWAVLKGQH